MKKHWLISVAWIALTASGAWAADTSSSNSPSTAYHEWTLDEARKHAHEKADTLDKMTEEEWAQKQAKHHAWYDKWKKMTPEEKAAYKKSRAAKRHKDVATSAPEAPAMGAAKTSSATEAPAPATSVPAEQIAPPITTPSPAGK